MSTANPLDSMKEIEAALRTCTPSQTLTMVSMEIAKIKRRIVRDMKIAGMRVEADVISHHPQQSYGAPLASHMQGSQRRGSHGSQSSPESEKWFAPSPTTIPPPHQITSLTTEALRRLASPEYSFSNPPTGALCSTAEECVACLLNALFIAMGWVPLMGGGKDGQGFERAVRPIDLECQLSSTDKAGWMVKNTRVKGYIELCHEGALKIRLSILSLSPHHPL